MREQGIRGVQRGNKQITTHADRNVDRPPDLVKRDFTATAPNQLWLAEITYCSRWDGWLYVAFILDVYARVIVGRQIATHMRTDLVLDALEMAAWRRQLIDGCVHHSDAGSQTGTPRSATPTGSPPPGCQPPSGPSATRTTMRWPKP